jgi:hypothetical protein
MITGVIELKTDKYATKEHVYSLPRWRYKVK